MSDDMDLASGVPGIIGVVVVAVVFAVALSDPTVHSLYPSTNTPLKLGEFLPLSPVNIGEDGPLLCVVLAAAALHLFVLITHELTLWLILALVRAQCASPFALLTCFCMCTCTQPGESVTEPLPFIMDARRAAFGARRLSEGIMAPRSDSDDECPACPMTEGERDCLTLPPREVLLGEPVTIGVGT